jgi:tRNA G37 N-methylase Trm5
MHAVNAPINEAGLQVQVTQIVVNVNYAITPRVAILQCKKEEKKHKNPISTIFHKKMLYKRKTVLRLTNAK